ncbi:MAG: hypothetical protein RLZZ200_1771 [Pseudomonadota bacterium]
MNGVRSANRRGQRQQPNPMYDRAKMIADEIWERANRLAEVLAPERPTDTEPLDDFDQFQILQTAAVSFSPGYWDDPNALEDLYRLKKQFTGRDDKQLLEFAKEAKARKDALPPPEMSPQNPKWQEAIAKMKGASDAVPA